MTSKEVRGFDKLLKDYTPADCQGYFLQVVFETQEHKVSLSNYLKDRKRTSYGMIRTLINDDEDKIYQANRDTEDAHMHYETFRKSPDLFANSDDKAPYYSKND